MSDVYLLKNQHQAFLDKQGEWLTCGDRKQLFRTPHKDEAINQRVEIAVKRPEMRVELISAALDERGLPLVNLPRPKKIETETGSDDTQDEHDLFNEFLSPASDDTRIIDTHSDSEEAPPLNAYLPTTEDDTQDA